MTPIQTAAFASVGRAVWLAQALEGVLVPLYEFFRMSAEPAYLEQTSGLVSDSKFKVPIKNLLKRLAETDAIDPKLYDLIDRYLEDRHTLVHRWFLQKGFAPAEDVEWWQELQLHGDKVAKQAEVLAGYFVGFAVQVLGPKNAVASPELELRMADLFRAR